jgi:hypothetical protein
MGKNEINAEVGRCGSLRYSDASLDKFAVVEDIACEIELEGSVKTEGKKRKTIHDVVMIPTC